MSDPTEKEPERLIDLLNRARHPEGVARPDLRDEILRRLVLSIKPRIETPQTLRERVEFMASPFYLHDDRY